MKIDDHDMDIINYLSDNPSKTSTDIAKTLFKLKNSDGNGRDVNKADSFIRARLKKLCGQGVVIKARTTPATYHVHPEKVYYGDGELQIDTIDGKKFTMDMGHFMVITDGKKKVLIKSIDIREERLVDK